MQECIQGTELHLVLIPLRLLFVVPGSQTFSVSDELGHFEDPVGCFAGPVSWGLPGRILPIWFIAVGVDRGLLAAVSVVGFLRQKMPLSPFPYCAGEEKVTARMCAVIMRFVSCQMTAKTDSIHASVSQPRLTDAGTLRGRGASFCLVEGTF